MNLLILENQLKEIDELLKANHKKENHIGLLNGLSGISLFDFYYSKFLKNNHHPDLGIEILTNCINLINQGYKIPSYCSGIAGMGWLIDHLELEQFIDIESDDLLKNFDDYLYSNMVLNLNNGYYDFLYGSIGYAYYFLNRYKNTKNDILKEKYRSILLEFINSLKRTSEKFGKDMYKWRSLVDIKSKKEGFNLSLSHGMSSIVGILTKLCHYDDFKDSAVDLLRGAVNYIINFKSKNSNDLSLFPNWIAENSEIHYNSRVAWCYGDLGIGIKFWFASKILKDKNLEIQSIEILKHTAKRTRNEQSIVNDAGVCHGSYGNAQIFLRMYKETNDLLFKNTVDFWIQDGLNKANFKDGYVGYKQWVGHNTKWENKTTLLEGIAGIGLVIIDYLKEDENNWDECLLIS